MKIASNASRGRRTIASIVALVIAAGVPVTLAALHNGFPVSSVKLNAKDVWVTNNEQALAGRLNRQIDELTAAAATTSNSFDVVQDGAEVYLHDEAAGTLQRIERARTTLVQKTGVPANAEISLGKTTMSILDPESGKLWITGVENGLSFDQSTTTPAARLGPDSNAVVGHDGHVYATSPSNSTLYEFAGVDSQPTKTKLTIARDNQLSVVGDIPVILEPSENRVLIGTDKRVSIPAGSMKVQQPGAANDFALVASNNGLLKIPLDGGSPQAIQAQVPVQSSGSDVSAPVFLDGCIYGAFAGAQRYVQQCGTSPVQRITIEQATEGDDLEFRVNEHVIALNNLQNGNTWVLSSKLVLVKNWDEVRPPKESKTQKGHKKATEQSFEDQLAHRTSVNHPPVARPDQYGIRPGRTTILPVTDNDTDQDGDVLVISKFSQVPAGYGKLDLIDGGRALQLTPGKTAVGAQSFSYTISDGRGGTDQTNVDLTVVPPNENHQPSEIRAASVSVEVGQSISYDVLTDWTDPDGDELEVVAATPTSADTVRFTPDGFLTFQSKSGTQGAKTVNYTVSDGTTTATGKLTVNVKGAGTLTPVGTPDFAQVFAGETTVVQPLQNDLSPSGQPLSLVSVSGAPASATVVPNIPKNSVSVESLTPGTIYLTYKVAASSQQGEGIIRVDVVPNPSDDLPPIAVKDVAYLRAGQSASVKVLANDVSPMGRVLSVQSVDTDSTDQSLKVELLNNTIARLTAPTGLTKQTQFTYTISDGEHTSVAGVTVVPVAPLVNRQPPIAVNDTATVRAGDIVSVAVLDNDYSPDQEQLFVQPKLASTANDGGGLAFVNANTVRYQAPTKAGQYFVTYRVADQYGESATARVTFTVTAPDAKDDRPPAPVDQTARAFAGQTVRINVPLDGIDPDGDSVVLDGVNVAPGLGRIIDDGPTWFDYQAFPTSQGTDRFTYDVEDGYGAVGTGTINIGVIPRGDLNARPVAVNDNVEVRPGKTVSSQVMANDSDPNGFKLTLLKKLTDVAPALSAHVSGAKVIITAPKKEGEYSLQYTITNNQGGQDPAFVIVKVSKNAKPQYPTAQDDYLKSALVHGRTPIKVDIESLIDNPNGEDSALLISAEGPNSGDVTVDQATGTLSVTPADKRFAVAYRVTDPTTKTLTATAFIMVPPVNSAEHPAKPHLKNPLPKQVVKMNSSREWKLSDIVVDPSGKPVILTSADKVKALNSNGSKAYIDKNTIRYTPAHDFRGITAITFEVTDGSSASDPHGVTATLTMPITVGDTNFDDVAPSFTLVKLPIQAGEKPTVIDLRDSTSDPNPDLIPQFTYDSLGGQTADIKASIDGSKLSVSSPLGVQPGATATLTVKIHYKEFTVTGKIIVTTVRSTRPLAQAVEDDAKGQRNVSYTTNVLTNDYNPYADLNKPLTLTNATVENAADTSATVTFTADGSVTVHPGPAFIGVVSVVYTERDASNDPARDVQGRLLLTVRDVPSQPSPPTIVDQSDKAVTVGWQAPATNGEEIISYTITTSGGIAPVTVGKDAAQATITGLTNGSSYTFQVSAENALGDGAYSNPSAAAIPFGKPGAPSSASITASNNGSGDISMSWGAASGNGRNVTNYTWTLSDGRSGTTAGLSASASGHVGTTYRVSVVANNPAGSGPGTTSGSDVPQPGAPSSATTSVGGAGDSTVTMTWGAAASTEPITRYEISINNGAYTAATSPHTFAGAFGTPYSFQVRAISAGQTSAATASNSATPQPPAQPSATIVERGPNQTCSDGGSGCRAAIVTFANIQPGTYQASIQEVNAGGSVVFTGSTKNCAVSNGSLCTAGGIVGVPPSGDTVRVWIRGGPSGTVYTPGLNRTDWGNLPHQ